MKPIKLDIIKKYKKNILMYYLTKKNKGSIGLNGMEIDVE